jgi:hypothetical protein
MKEIVNQHYETERSLYNQQDLHLVSCRFEGPSDGESSLKESSNIFAESCYFDLRYPFWHDEKVRIANTIFTEKSRAAFWYDHDVEVKASQLHGIKAFRECVDVALSDCDIVSPEFLWRDRGVKLSHCTLTSEYAFFEDQAITVDSLTMNGKYSFQYVRGGTIAHSELHTKDAFWHSENLTVSDSLIDGEYLGWYSKNLHLVRCHIKGTQPLCYCEGLVLEDCTMENADFAFEYSDVQADIKGAIVSVKNPKSGRIVADHIGEIIEKDSKNPNHCSIEIRGK